MIFNVTLTFETQNMKTVFITTYMHLRYLVTLINGKIDKQIERWMKMLITIFIYP